MARKPRLHVSGGVYHVMLRGNAGQDIFFSDNDWYYFYLLVQQGIEHSGHRIHIFCLMNKHIHLAVQVAEDPLAKIMQNLSLRYTRWINKQQKGRYKMEMRKRVEK